MTQGHGPLAAHSDIPTRDRLPSLTGLRFWAAALVVGYHLTQQVGSVQPISAVVWFGRTGVSFFFVLSGFVLAWTYLDSPTGIGVFLWRRFARLWPLVAVTGLMSLAVWTALSRPIDMWASISTFTFLQAWRPEWAAGANPAAWSLSDEAFFYLLLPALLALAATSRRRRLLWAVVLVAMPALFLWAWLGGWLNIRFDYFPPVRILQFVVGVLCGVALRRGVRVPIRLRAAVIIVLTYHVVLYPLHLLSDATGGHGRAQLYSGSQWFATLPFALLIVTAAQADIAGRRSLLGANGMLRLGHWSFAWYLVHEVCLRAVRAVWRPETLTGVVAQWLVVGIGSVCAAGLLYTLVEHPAERWLRGLVPDRRARHERALRAEESLAPPAPDANEGPSAEQTTPRIPPVEFRRPWSP